ncbi:MAG: hypothetical protein ACXWP0_01215 [Ktedonobacterales bacterium]
MAKALIALSLALWAAFSGALLSGIVTFADPRVAGTLVAIASMLEVFFILYIYMMAAAVADDLRRNRRK